MSPAIRRLWGVLSVIAVVAALYWPTAASYSAAWTDFDNRSSTHGYLILLMCVALFYMRRYKLVGPLPRISVLPCVALAILSCAWVLAFRAGIQTAHQMLLPVILWTAVYAIFGWRIGRSCLFPIGFIYFALPFWGLLNEPLQALTIFATRILLRSIGLPVQFSGNLVHIPEGTFAIEGGCSGLHFLVVALAIAAYYGALHRDTLRHRLFLLALAAALALLTNWLRVSSIITAGHVTNMQSYLVRVSHYGFGWVVFAVAMALFFLIASRLPLQSSNKAYAPRAVGTDAVGSSAAAAPLLVIAAVALGPLLAWGAALGDATAVTAPLAAPRVTDWTAPVAAVSVWRPLFVGADRVLLAVYRRGAAEVEWYTADYAYQRQGRKLLGYDNSIFDASTFAVVDAGVIGQAGRRFVQMQLQEASGAQSLIWYVYQIGGRQMTSGLRAQLFYGLHSLTGPVDSRIVAFRTNCDPNCATARERLRIFSASICDNASRFDNRRRDRPNASDKL